MSSFVTSVAFADADLQPIACSRAPIHTKKFLGLVALLLCCHLTNALISEHLLAGARIFKFPIFFTCFQCGGYIFIAFVCRTLLRSERRRTPLRTYAFMGALQAVTLASSVRRSCHVWPTTATCGQPLIVSLTPSAFLLCSDPQHALPEFPDCCGLQKLQAAAGDGNERDNAQAAAETFGHHGCCAAVPWIGVIFHR